METTLKTNATATEQNMPTVGCSPESSEQATATAATAIAPMSTSTTATSSTPISNPFNLPLAPNESVNLNTGAAIFRTNILSLPGRNGFNLNLDLVYDSSDANISRAEPSYFNQVNLVARHNLPHSVCVGWKFDLPYIAGNSLYLPGLGSFALCDREIWTGRVTFRDPTSQGMRLVNNEELAFHDGTVYRFSTRVRFGENHQSIQSMTDRFGNTIRFEMSGGAGRIIDTNGRVISIQRHNNGVNRTITITAPDNNRHVLNIDHSQLTSIQNPVGATTTFSYNVNEYLFHLFYKVPSLQNSALLLNQVTYPSGASLHYSYNLPININLGKHGVTQSFRVSQSLMRSSQPGSEHKRTNFTYTNEHTAFPSTAEHLPRTHTYSVAVTQNNGIQTEYTFNYQHLNTTKVTRLWGTLLSTQTTAYNQYKLPTSVTLTEHALTPGNNNTRTTATFLGYNRYGQVVSIISPQARMDGSIFNLLHDRTQHTTSYTYDNRFGQMLTKTAMPNVSTTVVERNTLTADGRNIVSKVVEENGHRLSRTDYLHDTHGNVTQMREYPNANGSEFITTNITYNRGTLPSQIQTTGIRDADNSIAHGNGIVERRFTYDTMWRKLTEADPNGHVARWQYDAIGRVTRQTAINGGVETYTYNDTQNTLTYRTVLGADYVYRYNQLGKLYTITAPVNQIILTNTYDSRMRLTETFNAEGQSSSQRTLFRYDIFDRIIRKEHLRPNRTVIASETIHYNDIMDAAGNSSVTTVINGDARSPDIETFVQYDRFGRKIQEGTTGGKIVSYTHDNFGRITREQSLGVDNTYTHNPFGVTSVRNIEGNTSRNNYDSMGRLVSSSDFMGNYTRFTHDALGRLVRKDVPFERVGDTTHNASTRYHYGRTGNVTRTDTLTSRPGQTQTWSSVFNIYHHNMLTTSRIGDTGTGGITTRYTYNQAGNILTKRVGEGTSTATTTYTYNNRGQLTRETDPMGRAETYTYDANGLPLTKTDRNGTVFTNRYNHLGKLMEETAHQNTHLRGIRNYAYTATGLPMCMTVNVAGVPAHFIHNSYDAQGRLTQQRETGNITKTYTYNTANNPTEMRVLVNGEQQHINRYSYNSTQRLNSMACWSGTVVDFTYNANGNRLTEQYSGSAAPLRTTYTYNLAGLVTRMVNGRENNNAINSQFDYTYHLDGNIHSVTDQRPAGQAGTTGTRTSTYTYDNARRLTREADISTLSIAPTITHTYTYDNRGNRIRMETQGAWTNNTSYTYDLNNRLRTEHAINSTDNVMTMFTYDNNGNQLTRTMGSQTQTRHYNAFNQLESLTFQAATIPLQTTASYTYRADGLRHSVTDNNGDTTTHVWNGKHIIMACNEGGGTINVFDRTPDGQLIDCHPHGVYLHNARGDVVQQVSNNGNVTRNSHYSAFGEGGIVSGDNTFRFNSWNTEFVSSRFMRITENNLPNVISYTPTWEDPQFVLRMVTIRQKRTFVNVTVTANENSAGQIFYRRQGQGFSEARSVWFNIIPGTRRYQVDLGTIDAEFLRIDIGVEGSPVTVRDIEVRIWERRDNSHLFRFNGEMWDEGSQEYYLRARNYNTRLGRFSQPDPFWNAFNSQGCSLAVRQSANLYAYCVNNPVKWVDSSGLAVQPALMGIRTLIGRHLSDNIRGFLSGAVGPVQLPGREVMLFEGDAYNPERFQRAQSIGSEIGRHDYYFRVELSAGVPKAPTIPVKGVVGYTWYFGLATRSKAEYFHIGAGIGVGNIVK